MAMLTRNIGRNQSVEIFMNKINKGGNGLGEAIKETIHSNSSFSLKTKTKSYHIMAVVKWVIIKERIGAREKPCEIGIL